MGLTKSQIRRNDRRIFHPAATGPTMSNNDFITIVSGLPRSGTSMMMMMLEAGGIEPMTDGIRAADADNPKGYYEFERIKKIREDKAWLPEARGRVIKMISQLLLDLPAGFEYRIILMRRKMEEILASQREMLVRRGTNKPGGPSDEEMGKMLAMHVEQVLGMMGARDDAELLEVDYNAMLREPRRDIDRLNEFLGGGLDTVAMRGVIDKSLYRQRK